jgi:hypothetical protein
MKISNLNFTRLLSLAIVFVLVVLQNPIFAQQTLWRGPHGGQFPARHYYAPWYPSYGYYSGVGGFLPGTVLPGAGFYGNYYPSYGYYAGYSYPYGGYYLGTGSGVFGPYVGPPIFEPAEANFGPQAMQRFMGVPQIGPNMMNPQPQVLAMPLKEDAPLVLRRNQNQQQLANNLPQLGQAGANQNQNNQPAQDPQNPGIVLKQDPFNDGPLPERESNAAARKQAWAFVALGDRAASQQKWADAFSNYHKAAGVAPELADLWYREGHSLVAMKQYEQAARIYRRAVRLEQQRAAEAPLLSKIWGENQKFVRDLIRQNLRETVDMQKENAALNFALGVYGYFDEQPEQSRGTLRRAVDLDAPTWEEVVELFRKRIGPPAVPQAVIPPAAAQPVVPQPDAKAGKVPPPIPQPEKVAPAQPAQPKGPFEN